MASGAVENHRHGDQSGQHLYALHIIKFSSTDSGPSKKHTHDCLQLEEFADEARSAIIQLLCLCWHWKEEESHVSELCIKPAEQRRSSLMPCVFVSMNQMEFSLVGFLLHVTSC